LALPKGYDFSYIPQLNAILNGLTFLAAIIVPLALISAARGLNMDKERHKKITKWVMPIWLHVSSTGVLIYLMISPYYN